MINNFQVMLKLQQKIFNFLDKIIFRKVLFAEDKKCILCI